MSCKKQVQTYWSENPPGIEVEQRASRGSRDFYELLDKERYLVEDYLLDIISQVDVEGKRILEVGCGLGSDSRQFSIRGADIVSMDLSPSNVVLTCKGFKVCDLSGYSLVADAESLPFREESFDYVYSFGVLHHTPNTQGAIDEIRRVLKPRGWAIAMLYNKGLSYKWIWLRHGLIGLESFRKS